MGREFLSTSGSIAVGLLMVTVFLLVIIGLPFLLIWCLNTLGIASASYGFWQWLASFLLTALFLGGSSSEE